MGLTILVLFDCIHDLILAVFCNIPVDPIIAEECSDLLEADLR